ncbi:hypothetical protein FRC02_006210 [Tulasnella sp. 418]|nr:hypothetical protein FRC02_006210 [Tulasnella sp. 418]
MGSYNVTSNTWCVPRLERFTIVDCQYEPHQLLKLIRARYVHDSQSSTQPDPLLSLQVAQLQDDFSLFQIKPDIKEEVESILGRDNVGWPVADEAELSTDSDSELEEDSEIDSDDEGISQPWRRARRVKPIERDYGSMDVPYYFRKGKRHH